MKKFNKIPASNQRNTVLLFNIIVDQCNPKNFFAGESSLLKCNFSMKASKKYDFREADSLQKKAGNPSKNSATLSNFY